MDWISNRARGSLDTGSPIRADTIAQALAVVRYAHVERELSEKPFDSPTLKAVLSGIRRTQEVKKKKKAAPLTKAWLEQITSAAPVDLDVDTPLSNKALDELNYDGAYKLAFSAFLRTAEVTCEAKDLENQAVFEQRKLQRRDIAFADDDSHMVVTLRSSKTDTKHEGVEIVVAATGEATCPVRGLRALYTLDRRPGNTPLFRTSKGLLSRNNYINTMQQRLKRAGCTNWRDFTGHSPRRGAAQHAADHGILEHEIQSLGRWSSAAFRGYFEYSQAHKFHLNRRFQTGRIAPLSIR